MNAPSPYALERAMSILMAVRERLLTEDPTIAEDERLFSDLLDGQGGDAIEVLDRLVRAAQHASSMATAAKIRAQDMMERSKRYSNREDTLRSVIMSAMEALGMKRREAADFTVGISAGTPSVHVPDVNAVPDEYVVIDRKPDKTKIGALLKNGEHPAWAELSNASPRLTIRSK